MTQKPRSGLLTASLLLLLTGCASPSIQLAPPDSLLLDTPIPVAEGRRNVDLMNWANALRCSLVQANADKAALRAWKAGIEYAPSADSSCE